MSFKPVSVETTNKYLTNFKNESPLVGVGCCGDRINALHDSMKSAVGAYRHIGTAEVVVY